MEAKGGFLRPSLRALAELRYAAMTDACAVATALQATDVNVDACDARDGRTALHYAAATGNADTAGFLITACGANAAARDRYGQSPLHLACSGAHAAVVHSLFAADTGVDANASNARHESPLRLAPTAAVAACLLARIAADVLQASL